MTGVDLPEPSWYGTSPPQAPPPIGAGPQPTAGDPTKVMSRRIIAWFLDLAIFLGVLIGLYAAQAEYVDIPPGIGDEACSLLETAGGNDVASCLDVGDQAWLLSETDVGYQTLATFGYLALFVVLQGATGGSPGKLLTGLRVVDASGRRAGIGRSLGRTLLWAVDAAPWIVPVVGPIVALTTDGHRRVGDMAAGTYVITAGAVGRPVRDSIVSYPAPGAGQTPPPRSTPSTTSTTAADAELADFSDLQQSSTDVHEPHRWPPATPPPTSPPVGPPASPPAGPLDGPPSDLIPETEPPPNLAPDPAWSRPPDELDVGAGPGVDDPGPPAWEPPVEPHLVEPPTDAVAAPEWPPPEWDLRSDPGPETPSPIDDPSPDATAPPPLPGWNTSDTDGPDDRTGPRPFTAPGAEPATAEASGAGPGDPDRRTDPGNPEPSPLPPPQWDPARATYLQWMPDRAAWLQWDAAAQRWKDIDT